jgi:hypothetical protein
MSRRGDSAYPEMHRATPRAETGTRRRVLLTALAMLGIRPPALAGELAWPSKPVRIRCFILVDPVQ